MRYRSLAVLEEGGEEMGTQYGPAGWLAGRPGWPGTATVSTSAYAAAAASVTALSQPATACIAYCR